MGSDELAITDYSISPQLIQEKLPYLIVKEVTNQQSISMIAKYEQQSKYSPSTCDDILVTSYVLILPKLFMQGSSTKLLFLLQPRKKSLFAILFLILGNIQNIWRMCSVHHQATWFLPTFESIVSILIVMILVWLIQVQESILWSLITIDWQNFCSRRRGMQWNNIYINCWGFLFVVLFVSIKKGVKSLIEGILFRLCLVVLAVLCLRLKNNLSIEFDSRVEWVLFSWSALPEYPNGMDRGEEGEKIRLPLINKIWLAFQTFAFVHR